MADLTDPQRILALPLPAHAEPHGNEAGATTVREYLVAILTETWSEPPKRLWGSSDWQYPIYAALIHGDVVAGRLDADGYIDDVDEGAADRAVTELIAALAPAPLRQRPGDQVLPTPNEHPTIHAQVAADLMARERLGVERYGTPLQPFNGRDALRDAYEELLDAAAYIKQRMAENPESPRTTFMQAWEWLRVTAGYDESVPLRMAARMVEMVRADPNHVAPQLDLAVEALVEAGVLERD